MVTVQALEVLEVISEVEKAKARIPADLKGTRPYSTLTLWTYYARVDHDPPGETCQYCKMFDGQMFRGDQLRTMFPDHYWKGYDIYPNVHKTLWGRESECSCLLIREPYENTSSFETWSDLDVDWNEQPAQSNELVTVHPRGEIKL